MNIWFLDRTIDRRERERNSFFGLREDALYSTTTTTTTTIYSSSSSSFYFHHQPRYGRGNFFFFFSSFFSFLSSSSSSISAALGSSSEQQQQQRSPSTHNTHTHIPAEPIPFFSGVWTHGEKRWRSLSSPMEENIKLKGGKNKKKRRKNERERESSTMETQTGIADAYNCMYYTNTSTIHVRI